jgi:hypothetical protein
LLLNLLRVSAFLLGGRMLDVLRNRRRYSERAGSNCRH